MSTDSSIGRCSAAALACVAFSFGLGTPAVAQTPGAQWKTNVAVGKASVPASTSTSQTVSRTEQYTPPAGFAVVKYYTTQMVSGVASGTASDAPGAFSKAVQEVQNAYHTAKDAIAQAHLNYPKMPVWFLSGMSKQLDAAYAVNLNYAYILSTSKTAVRMDLKATGQGFWQPGSSISMYLSTCEIAVLPNTYDQAGWNRRLVDPITNLINSWVAHPFEKSAEPSQNEKVDYQNVKFGPPRMTDEDFNLFAGEVALTLASLSFFYSDGDALHDLISQIDPDILELVTEESSPIELEDDDRFEPIVPDLTELDLTEAAEEAPVEGADSDGLSAEAQPEDRAGEAAPEPENPADSPPLRPGGRDRSH